MSTWRILLGDVRETLASLPAQSVAPLLSQEVA